jgi:hypothetical protein
LQAALRARFSGPVFCPPKGKKMRHYDQFDLQSAFPKTWKARGAQGAGRNFLERP